MRTRSLLLVLLAAACEEPRERRAEITDFTAISGLVASEPLYFRVHWTRSDCERVSLVGGHVRGQALEIEILVRTTSTATLGRCANLAVPEDTTFVFGHGLTGEIILRGLQPRGIAALERVLVIAPEAGSPVQTRHNDAW